MTTNTDDKRVTNAYRDLANEQAPAELDTRVLAMAAREARTRYGWTRAWIRPVAWAATIALSLAFLLEISQLDEAPMLPEPEAPAAPATTEASGATEASAAPAATEARELDGAADDAFAAEDMPLLREAEEQARVRAGEARAVKDLADEAVTAAPEAAMLQKAAAPARRERAITHCDDAARAVPDSWYACILELRGQGLADAAALELEALLEAFPDFREPAPQ